MMNRARKAIVDGEIDDAAVVAESLQRDFARLIAIFDRQLDSAADGGSTVAVSSARGAAQRGLKLSQELAEILQRIDVRA